MKNLIIYLLILSSFNGFAQEDAQTLETLTYLANSDLEKGLEYAKEKNKPLMIYFNSVDCHSCEQFAKGVLDDDSVENYLKSKYICVKVNIKNADAGHYAKKYDVETMPQMVLVSADLSIHYTLQMKLDPIKTIQQAAYFHNVVALAQQIELYQKTNNISYDKASEAMAASYAKRDFKKSPTADVNDMIYLRSLNMKMFAKYKEYYLIEWAKLKSKKK